MKTINSFVDETTGMTYSVPTDEYGKFIQEVPNAKRQNLYQAGGKTYAITDDQAEAFAKDMPDAVPVRRIRKADGSTYDIPMTEGAMARLNQLYLKDPSFQQDRDEAKAHRDAAIATAQNAPTEGGVTLGDTAEDMWNGVRYMGSRALAPWVGAFATSPMRLAGSALRFFDRTRAAGEAVTDAANLIDQMVAPDAEAERVAANSGLETVGKIESTAQGIGTFAAMNELLGHVAGNILMSATAGNDAFLNTYEEAKAHDLSDDDARNVASMALLTNSTLTLALGALPVNRILKGLGASEKAIPGALKSTEKLVPDAFDKVEKAMAKLEKRGVNTKTTRGRIDGLMAGIRNKIIVDHAKTAVESGGIMGLNGYLNSLEHMAAQGQEVDFADPEAIKEGLGAFAEGVAVGGAFGLNQAYGTSAKAVRRHVAELRKRGLTDAQVKEALFNERINGAFGIRRSAIEEADREILRIAASTETGRGGMYVNNPEGIRRFWEAYQNHDRITPEIANEAGLPLGLEQREYEQMAHDFVEDAQRADAAYQKDRMREKAVADGAEKRAERANAREHQDRRSGLVEAFADGAVKISERNALVDQAAWSRLLNENKGDIFAADIAFRAEMREREYADNVLAEWLYNNFIKRADAERLAQARPEAFRIFCRENHMNPEDPTSAVHFYDRAMENVEILDRETLIPEVVDDVGPVSGTAPKALEDRTLLLLEDRSGFPDMKTWAEENGMSNLSERELQRAYLAAKVGARKKAEPAEPALLEDRRDPAQKALDADRALTPLQRKNRLKDTLANVEEELDLLRRAKQREEAEPDLQREEIERDERERLEAKRRDWMLAHGLDEYPQWLKANGLTHSPFAKSMYDAAIRDMMRSFDRGVEPPDEPLAVAAKAVQQEFDFGEPVKETPKPKAPKAAKAKAKPKPQKETTDEKRTQTVEGNPVPEQAEGPLPRGPRRGEPGAVEGQGVADGGEPAGEGQPLVSESVIAELVKSDPQAREINARYRAARQAGEDGAEHRAAFRRRVEEIRAEVARRRAGKEDFDLDQRMEEMEKSPLAAPSTNRGDFTPEQYAEGKRNPIPRKSVDAFAKSGDIRHLAPYLKRTELGRNMLENYHLQAKDDKPFADRQLANWLAKNGEVMGVGAKAEKAVKAHREPVKESSDDVLLANRNYAKEELSRIGEYLGGGDLEAYVPDVDKLTASQARQLGDAFNKARLAADVASDLDGRSIDNPSDRSLARRFKEAEDAAERYANEANELAQYFRDVQDGKIKSETLASKTREKTEAKSEAVGEAEEIDNLADVISSEDVTLKDGTKVKLVTAEGGYFRIQSEDGKKVYDGGTDREKLIRDSGVVTAKETAYREWLATKKDGNGRPMKDTKTARKMYEKSAAKTEKPAAKKASIDYGVKPEDIKKEGGVPNVKADAPADAASARKLLKGRYFQDEAALRREMNRLPPQAEKLRAAYETAIAEAQKRAALKSDADYGDEIRRSRKPEDADADRKTLGAESIDDVLKRRDALLPFYGTENVRAKVDAADRLVRDYLDGYLNAAANSAAFTDDTQAAVNLVKHLADGVKVVYAKDARKDGVYAEYDRAKGVVTVYGDARAADVMHDVGYHVLRRWAEQNAPHDAVAKAVLDNLVAYADAAPEWMKEDVRQAYAEDRLGADALNDEFGARRFQEEQGGRLLAEARNGKGWLKTSLRTAKDALVSTARAMGLDVNSVDFKRAAQMKPSEMLEFLAGEVVKGKRIAMEQKALLKPDAKPAETAADGEPMVDIDGKAYSKKSMMHDLNEGKMMADLVKHKVFTEDQAKQFRKDVEEIVDLVSQRAFLDMNESYGKEGRGKFLPFKPNSDPLYKKSLDFSTLCKKRIMTQMVIDRLQSEIKGDFLTADEQVAVRKMLKDYQAVDEGLQIACHLCYVEAARLKVPAQLDKLFASETSMRDAFVNYLAKKSKTFKAENKRFQENWKKAHGYAKDAVKKDMTSADRTAFSAESKAFRQANYKPTADEEALIAKFIRNGRKPFLTVEGQSKVAQDDPRTYDFFTTYVREATHSKALEPDVPYYYGDAKKLSKKFIELQNRQGTGLRHQSWSDFQITHLLDTITALADLSVRGAKMHEYTKVPESVRIFGKSGIMFNLSLIPEFKDGKWGFSSVEGMDYETAKRLRKEFPQTAGTVAIAANHRHFIDLLNNPYVDYVIPYHSSGMPVDVRKMMGIGEWFDYENIQHTSVNKQIREPKVKPEKWHVEPTLDEWVVRDPNKSGILQMQESARRYVDLCNARGMRPKFAEVVATQQADGTWKLKPEAKNYWKALVDHKWIDQTTDRLIEQKPVRPEFDMKAVRTAVADEIGAFDQGRVDRAFDHVKGQFKGIGEYIANLKANGEDAKGVQKKVKDKLAQVRKSVPVDKSLTDYGDEYFGVDDDVRSSRKPYDETTEDGRRFNEKYADGRAAGHDQDTPQVVLPKMRGVSRDMEGVESEGEGASPSDANGFERRAGEVDSAKEGVRSSRKSLGVPYQGSKGQIAEELVDRLPEGKRFVDLFSGGGAMTHAAMRSGKYGAYRMNDLDGRGQDLFLGAMDGAYRDYAAARTADDWAAIRDTPEGVLRSRMGNGRQFNADAETTERNIRRVNRVADELGGRRGEIEDSKVDYRKVELKDGDVVYADIPYAGTDTTAYNGAGKFDHAAFNEWAQKQKVPVYVSSYAMPAGWTEIAALDAQGITGNKTERLFVQDKFADAVKSSIGQGKEIASGARKSANTAYPDAVKRYAKLLNEQAEDYARYEELADEIARTTGEPFARVGMGDVRRFGNDEFTRLHRKLKSARATELDDMVAGYGSRIESDAMRYNEGAPDATNPDVRMSRRSRNPAPPPAGAFMNDRESAGEKYMKNFADRYRPVKGVVMDTLTNLAGMSKEQARDWAENNAASPYHAKRVQTGRAEADTMRVNALRNDLERTLGEWKRDGLTVDDLGQWMYAMHAKDRNAQKLADHGVTDGAGMSDADAQAILDGYRARGVDGQLERARQALTVRLNRDFGLDYLHDAGLIDENSVNRLKAAYGEDYVPLKDDITDGEGVDYNRNGTVSNPLMRAVGRTTLAENPTAFMILGSLRNIANAHQNRAAETLARFVEAHPEIGQVRLVRPTDNINEDTVVFRRNTTVPVMDHGVQVGTEEVNQRWMVEMHGDRGNRMARAFLDADLHRGPAWLTDTTRWFASFATQLSPTFSVRNFLKDTVEVASDTMGTMGLRDAGRFLGRQFALMPLWNGNFRRVLREFRETGTVTGTTPLARDFREFVESGALIGGGGAREGYGEMTETFRDISRSLNRAGATARDIGRVWEAYKKWVGSINESIETMTRFNNFRNRRAAGESVEQAAMNAREGSTDFGMYGNQRWLNSVFMFSNSILGGTMRGAKTMVFGRYGRRLAAGMVALGVLEELADYALNGDEEEAENAGTGTGKDITEYERENGLNFRYGGKNVHIPMHLGPWSWLKYAGNNAARALVTKKISVEQAVKNVGASAATVASHFSAMGEKGFGEGSPSLANSMTPSVLQPLVQVKLNENYKGDTIYTEHTMQANRDRPDYKYARRNTNPLFVEMSRLINNMPWSGGNDHRKGAFDVPPEALEYLSKQVFKNFGTDVVNTVWEVPSRIYRTATDQGNGMELRTTPFVRDVVKSTPDVANRYYTESRAYNGDLREFKDMPARERAMFARTHYGMNGELKELAKRIDEHAHLERGEKKDGNAWVAVPNMTEKTKDMHKAIKLKLMARFLKLRETRKGR